MTTEAAYSAGSRFTDHTVVITGAASGIGAALALSFARQGAAVIGVDRDAAQLLEHSEALKRQGLRFLPIQGDVRELETWDRVQSGTSASFPVSTLVCGAYAIDRQELDAVTQPAWDLQWSVNVTGALLAIQSCATDLRRSSGSVIVLSSVHTTRSAPGHVGYATTKAALEGLARQLAVELAPRVRVNTVVVGPVETPAWASTSSQDRARSAQRTLLGRLGTVDDVTPAVLFLASDEARWITGASLTVDGGRNLHA